MSNKIDLTKEVDAVLQRIKNISSVLRDMEMIIESDKPEKLIYLLDQHSQKKIRELVKKSAQDSVDYAMKEYSQLVNTSYAENL